MIEKRVRGISRKPTRTPANTPPAIFMACTALADFEFQQGGAGTTEFLSRQAADLRESAP